MAVAKPSLQRPSWVEFGGWTGSFLCTWFLPVLLLGWHHNLVCHHGDEKVSARLARSWELYNQDACENSSLNLNVGESWSIYIPVNIARYIPGSFDFLVVLGFIALQGALQQWAPGTWVKGLPLLPDPLLSVTDKGIQNCAFVSFFVWPAYKLSFLNAERFNKHPLWYKCNGLASLAVTLLLLYGALQLSLLDCGDLLRRYDRLLVTSVILSHIGALYLFFKYPCSHRRGWEAYFLGVARNPRVGALPSGDDYRFDLKYFFEGIEFEINYTRDMVEGVYSHFVLST